VRQRVVIPYRVAGAAGVAGGAGRGVAAGLGDIAPEPVVVAVEVGRPFTASLSVRQHEDDAENDGERGQAADDVAGVRPDLEALIVGAQFVLRTETSVIVISHGVLLLCLLSGHGSTPGQGRGFPAAPTRWTVLKLFRTIGVPAPNRIAGTAFAFVRLMELLLALLWRF
jgi:hypothetical protein